MSEFELLHAEPGYKVRSFRDELLERRAMTIRAMRPAFTAMVIGIADQFAKMKANLSSLDLNLVKFAGTTWTKEGQIVIEIGYGALPPFMEGRYHVDEIIQEIIDKNVVIAPLRDELAQLTAAFVDQWGMEQQREPLLILGGITYDNFRWLNKQLVFDCRSGGQLYGWNAGRNAGARVTV